MTRDESLAFIKRAREWIENMTDEDFNIRLDSLNLRKALESCYYDIPVIRCPRCGAEQEDFDGFGFSYCPECGYCIHPASVKVGNKWICEVCGKETGSI